MGHGVLTWRRIEQAIMFENRWEEKRTLRTRGHSRRYKSLCISIFSRNSPVKLYMHRDTDRMIGHYMFRKRIMHDGTGVGTKKSDLHLTRMALF